METTRSRLIPKVWMVPEAFHLRLGNHAGRQRLMDEDGHLLLILHEAPKASDDADRKAAFFWRNPEGIWKSFPEGGGMTALNSHLEAYKTIIHSLDERVEAAQSASEYFSILKETTPLLRATRHMQEVLQKARELRKNDRSLLLTRDEGVELERAIDLAHADAKDGMEFVIAENAAEQADLSHKATLESRRLNRLAAFFFPLATLISLFGMNKPSEVLSQGSFWPVIGIGVLLGLVVGKIVGKPVRENSSHT